MVGQSRRSRDTCCGGICNPRRDAGPVPGCPPSTSRPPISGRMAIGTAPCGCLTSGFSGKPPSTMGKPLSHGRLPNEPWPCGNRRHGNPTPATSSSPSVPDAAPAGTTSPRSPHQSSTGQPPISPKNASPSATMSPSIPTTPTRMRPPGNSTSTETPAPQPPFFSSIPPRPATLPTRDSLAPSIDALPMPGKSPSPKQPQASSKSLASVEACQCSTSRAG